MSNIYGFLKMQWGVDGGCCPKYPPTVLHVAFHHAHVHVKKEGFADKNVSSECVHVCNIFPVYDSSVVLGQP